MSLSFKVVLIPADGSSPIEERVIETSEKDLIPCLITYIQRYYKEVSPLMTKEQKEVFKQQVLSQTKDKGPIPDEYFSHMADMHTVDVVPLQPNNKRTGMVAVNLYVDDKSVAKDLPINLRASEITTLAGNPHQIRGDAFIAKIHDDEANDIFTRIDFSISDLKSDAPWLELARSVNQKGHAKGVGTVAATGSCSEPSCGNKAGLRCGGCKRTGYCSKECQKKHWPLHKLECKRA